MLRGLTTANFQADDVTAARPPGAGGALPGGARMSTITARTAAEWRSWLARNHASEREVWLVIGHQDSATPSVRYAEAIEQALCFGWIDSHARKHGPDASVLRFTPRNPRSTWSRLNRERAARMIDQGLMTEHGLRLIDLAKARGTWEVAETVPADLGESLARDDAARRNFAAFPPSSRRLILEWIATAKRPDTRRRRIDRTVTLAAANVRAR